MSNPITMSWSDLCKEHIERFRLEERGRSYAINYPADCITEVFRKIYYSYPYEQRNGQLPIDMSIKVAITYDDLNNAMAESIRRNDEMNAIHSRTQDPAPSHHQPFLQFNPPK